MTMQLATAARTHAYSEWVNQLVVFIKATTGERQRAQPCPFQVTLPPQVQNGMQLLDRLLKDIVTESEHFEIEAFMPLLGERIYVSNPFSRQFLVGWIATLDSVPDIELLQVAHALT